MAAKVTPELIQTLLDRITELELDLAMLKRRLFTQGIHV
jgi:hypothetical protein